MGVDALADEVISGWLDELPERAMKAISRRALEALRARVVAGLAQASAPLPTVPAAPIHRPLPDDLVCAIVDIKRAVSDLRSELPRLVADPPVPVQGVEAPTVRPLFRCENDDVASPGVTPQSAARDCADRWSFMLSRTAKALVTAPLLDELALQIEETIQSFLTRPPAPQPVNIEIGPTHITGIWAEESSVLLSIGKAKSVVLALPGLELRDGEAWPKGIEAGHVATALPLVRDAMAAWVIQWTGRRP